MPVARPDWAADDDGDPGTGDTVAEHDELTAGTAPSDGVDDADGADTAGTTDASTRADGPSGAARQTAEPTDVESSVGAPSAEADDQLFRAAVRRRGLHAAPTDDGDDLDTSATGGSHPAEAQAPTVAPLPPVPTAAPLPPIPGVPQPESTTQIPATPLGQPVVPSSAGAGLDDGDATDDGDGPDGVRDDGAPDDRPVGSGLPRDEEPDVDETRIVSKTPTHAPFVLHFSTGERFGVHGTGLLGRLPRPQPGERFDDLLTVHDPGKSVSKTHLELGRDGGDLWVSDRFSGNGTVVRHIDGSIRRCEPGRRYRVERGARVDIGEQFFLVQ
ncbi:FHA domain-containing protein [Curtobacterium sp. 1P10AnD]|uniref:FHA domain-containing protein n=1 Tax=Curtobacterium sp. 1P10AnD TaxID=3132283 RepID=UPI00399FEDDB